jgi:large subunit ribosomal protein L21
MPGVKMKYAIVESGGKQYKAVEGETIEVDRLPVNAGEKVGLERVLMVVDGDDISVGTPTVDGVQVSTTVTEHFKGPKIIVFKYSPRKRYRVKGGHRQQYTRLMVDAIGSSGKASKSKKAEAPAEKKAEAKSEKKVEKKEATAAKPAATSSSKGKKTEKTPTTASPKRKKAPAKKAPAKKTEKASAKKTEKTTAKKAPATSSQKGKKSTTKKTTKTSPPKEKKPSSTKKSEK